MYFNLFLSFLKSSDHLCSHNHTYTLSFGKNAGFICSRSFIRVSSNTCPELHRKSRPQATAATSDWRRRKRGQHQASLERGFHRQGLLTCDGPHQSQHKLVLMGVVVLGLVFYLLIQGLYEALQSLSRNTYEGQQLSLQSIGKNTNSSCSKLV